MALLGGGRDPPYWRSVLGRHAQRESLAAAHHDVSGHDLYPRAKFLEIAVLLQAFVALARWLGLIMPRENGASGSGLLLPRRRYRRVVIVPTPVIVPTAVARRIARAVGLVARSGVARKLQQGV